jgi:hypothetical protein
LLNQSTGRLAIPRTEFEAKSKESSESLLQSAKARSDQELAELTADLARVTQKRLEELNYESELGLAEAELTSLETRVAAALVAD